MSVRSITYRAKAIDALFRSVRREILERYAYFDPDMSKAVHQALLMYVQELSILLRNSSVRGHLDPKIGEPEVDKDTTTGMLLRRMKHQVKHACLLSDLAHLGPEANANEAEVLLRVEQILHQLYDIIPTAKSCGSSRD